MDADVVIAGGGPTGLMLACELRLAGIRPVVLERLTEPTGLSKALALVGRSVDALDYRGLLDRFRARAAVAIPGAAHFALIPLVERGDHRLVIRRDLGGRSPGQPRGRAPQLPAGGRMRPGHLGSVPGPRVRAGA